MESNTSQTSAKKTDNKNYFDLIFKIAKWLQKNVFKRKKKRQVRTIENNGKPVEIIDLEEPFTAVRVEDEWSLCLGKYRLTTGLKNFEEVEKDSLDSSWIRIMQIMKIMILDAEEERQHLDKYNVKKITQPTDN